MKSTRSRTAAAVLTLLALLMAACGGGAEDTEDATAEETADETEETTESGDDAVTEGESTDEQAAVEGDPVAIEWVSFQPSSHPEPGRVEEYFLNPITEASGGDITFEWRGGPDTMAPSDMGLAVQSGAVDAAMIYVGAYEGVVPGVGGWSLTQLTPEVERENGAVEYFDSLHQENGLKYLARVQPQEENFFFTWLLDTKLETKEDFANALIGSAAGARAAVQGWGATVENVPVPDNYTALERGIVQGVAGQPLEGAVANGWYELTNYVIDHPYYQSTVVLIMNLDVWESLSESQQQLITDAMADGEQQVIQIREEALAEARATIESAGTEFYELEPDVAEWYLDTAYQSAWDLQMENYPDVTERLQELLRP